MSNSSGKGKGKSKSVPISCKNFHEFFSKWLERQQAYLNELVDASTNPKKNPEVEVEVGELVEKVLLHYEEYYEEKYKVINQDIFQLFSPPWLTTFEKAFLWIGGLFKPSLPLGLTEMALPNMEAGQADRLEGVKDEVGWMERKLMDGLAEVQESMGSRTLTELTKNWRKLVDGEVSDFEEAILQLKGSLGKVVEEADNLRRYAVAKVVEILDLDQTVVLLAAIGRYQLRIRARGLKDDFDVRRDLRENQSES